MTALRLGALLVAAALLVTAPALAQPKGTDCPQPSAAAPAAKAPSPPRIEGTVVKTDPATGIVTVRGEDGRTHDFRGHENTVRDLKVGDRIEMRLRQQASC